MILLYTEAEIKVVGPTLIQKHYTNAPRIAMVVQQTKIKWKHICIGFVLIL